MHRSSSTTRVSDEFFNPSTSPTAALDAAQLPTYDPLSHVAKKERSRLRSAENAIHAIPLVLLLCAIILWVFSNPVVDIVNKGDSIVPRTKDLIENDNNLNSDLLQKRLLPDLEQDDFDPARELVHQKGLKLLESKA